MGQGNSKPVADRSSGFLVMKLNGVPCLTVGKNYYNEPDYIGGIPWSLGVRVENAYDGSKWVLVYLDASLCNFKQDYFLVKKSTRLVRQTTRGGMEDIVESVGIIYPSPDNGSRATGQRLTSYDALVKPESGWLLDDALLITCHVEAEKVRLSDKVDDGLTFSLDSLSERKNNITYCSDPVTVMGIRWRLGVEFDMIEGESYLGVCFQGIKEDFKGRRFSFHLKVTLIRQSSSQPDLDDDQRSGISPSPFTGSVSMGNPNFIKFSDLMDPKKNWVMKDTLVLRCRFTLYEILENRGLY